MQIIKVRSRKDMRKFVAVPSNIHSGSDFYVPPIWMEERGAYKKKNNPILLNSDFELFLLEDDKGKPIGRTIAYIDFIYNNFYNVKMGFFGAFECVDDKEAADMLVSSAEDFLRVKGMDVIRGPINPAAENWGFVFEGYDSPPVFMSPWNPEYYHVFFTGAGYGKVKDLLVYEIDVGKGYELPERYREFAEKFFEHFPEISIRRLDLKNIKDDAKAIWEVSNLALADNWGFVPVELPVMEDMLKKLKLIVDPDAVWIVEESGKPVGFCLGFPDINIILKKIHGKLLPIGWARLLRGAKKLHDYRLFGLAVDPKWQGRALDALMYINLYNHLAHKNIRMEANYILEDNFRIKNSLEKLGMEYIKTYRIYEKALNA